MAGELLLLGRVVAELALLVGLNAGIAAGGFGCADGNRVHGDWAGVGILCRIGWEDKTRGRRKV